MSTSLRDLNRRVQAVSPPQLDIAGIVEHGNSRRRRRRAGLVAGTAALVAASIAIAGVVTPSQHHTDGPAHDLRPTKPRVSPRLLTYTDDYRERWNPGPHWLIQSFHYGDQRITLDVSAEQMDVTDEGVVVVGEDGGVYLADGDTVQRVGETQQDHAYASGHVDSGNTGSLASWFTPAEPTASLVVYDTDQRKVVAQREIPRCDAGCSQLGIVDGKVYVDDPADELAGAGPDNRVFSFDVTSGLLSSTDTRAFWEDLRSHPRALIKSNDPATGEVVSADAWLTTRDDRLVLQWLVAGAGPNGEDVFDYGGYDSLGRPLGLTLPDGYTPTEFYRLFQWLDDDRFAVIGGLGDGSTPDVPHGQGYGDILICDLDAQRCRLASAGPEKRPALTDDGFRIVPDLDAPN